MITEFLKIFFSDTLFIGSGILVTLNLLLGSLVIGFVLGLLIAILRYNKIATFIIDHIISFFRGVPLILQLSFVYFALPSLIKIKLGIVSSGIIALGLNGSAYIAEILRAGIESIPVGQFEACQTLKISNFKMWKDIILPQVTHNILPAVVNEKIIFLKDTSLIATIGGMDIMRSSQVIAAEKFTYFTPLCIAAVYYYILVIVIEKFGKILHKKLQYT